MELGFKYWWQYEDIYFYSLGELLCKNGFLKPQLRKETKKIDLKKKYF